MSGPARMVRPVPSFIFLAMPMNPGLLYTTYFLLGVLFLGVALLGRRSLAGCYAVLAVPVVLLLATQSEPKPRYLFADFSYAYYPAGRLIHSNPDALYDRNTMHYVNLPILAYLFTPLSLLRESTARVLFTLGGLAAVVAAWHLLCRMTRAAGWTRAVLLAIVLLNGPLYYSFREGNLTHYVLLLLVGALACLERGRSVAAGILLGLAALVKLPLFLLGLYFLLQRRWRVLAGAAGTVLLVFGVSLLVCGGKLHRAWRSESLLPFAGRPLVAFNVQSASSFLARLTTDRNPNTSPWGIYESWKPLEVERTFKAAHYAFLALLGGATVWACRRTGRSGGIEVQRLEFSLFLCLALAASPISWTHYYLLLLVPLCLCAAGRGMVPARPLWFGLLAASGALLSAPVVSFAANNPVGRALISHYLFGGLLLWGTLFALRRCAEKVSVVALVGPDGVSRSLAVPERRAALPETHATAKEAA
jgi:hypothetical protein